MNKIFDTEEFNELFDNKFYTQGYSVNTITKIAGLENKNVIFENGIQYKQTELGDYQILDFTNYNNKGNYKIKVGNLETNYFEISSNPYLSSIVKSINFLRLLRCGEDIDGVHSACHLNCRTMNENGTSVPNFGGWHDAGDVSQFEI